MQGVTGLTHQGLGQRLLHARTELQQLLGTADQVAAPAGQTLHGGIVRLAGTAQLATKLLEGFGKSAELVEQRPGTLTDHARIVVLALQTPQTGHGAQTGQQGGRRHHHHALGEGVLEQAVVMLEGQREGGLHRQEQEHEIR